MKCTKRHRAFFLTALGAAMGLGNCLRFPGLCAHYGGGAFVLAYFIALAGFGVPVLCAELKLGRSESGFPVSFGDLTADVGKGRKGKGIFSRFAVGVGWAQCANSAFVGVYYAAVVAYIARMAIAIFPLSLAGGEGASDLLFGKILRAGGASFWFSPSVGILLAAAWAAFFFFLCGGRERLAKAARVTVVVPVLFFCVVSARGLTYENSSAALTALFLPDFSALNDGGLWANAFCQALFSLSLAAGIMPSFAKMMPGDGSPLGNAAAIAAANFLGCILSSVALFTSLYGCGLQDKINASGIITAFCVYPSALVGMFPRPVVSGIFGILFYASLLLTALQSSLSLLQAFALPLAARVGRPCKAVAARICAVGLVCSLPLCTNFAPTVLSFCDRLANGVNLLALAVCECAIFAAARLGRTRLPRRSAKAGKEKSGRALRPSRS